jgi:hypothetical protein
MLLLLLFTVLKLGKHLPSREVTLRVYDLVLNTDLIHNTRPVHHKTPQISQGTTEW